MEKPAFPPPLLPFPLTLLTYKVHDYGVPGKRTTPEDLHHLIPRSYKYLHLHFTTVKKIRVGSDQKFQLKS
jgi:hypothetical protein